MCLLCKRKIIKKSRKAISGFKVRIGDEVGLMVTLRNNKMYDFLDKLINLGHSGNDKINLYNAISLLLEKMVQCGSKLSKPFMVSPNQDSVGLLTSGIQY